MPVIELDDLYWRPGWTPAPAEAFRAVVGNVCASPRWIAVGNYRVVRDVLWACADTVIWLDYGFLRTLGQLMGRTWRRVRNRQPACNGNIETWRRVFSRDSIFLWLLKTHGDIRRRHGAIMAAPADYPHIRFLRLATPAEAERFVAATVLRKEARSSPDSA